jgi:formylglycine-generating enzyme required for sulfatase activity
MKKTAATPTGKRAPGTRTVTTKKRSSEFFRLTPLPRWSLIGFGIACLLMVSYAPAYINNFNTGTSPLATKTRTEIQFQAGMLFKDTFRNGAQGPTMVVVPTGTFQMGSPDDEHNRHPNEGPRHQVTLEKPFSLGRTEVTVGEFRTFVTHAGYVTTAEKSSGSFYRNRVTGDWERNPQLSWEFDHNGQPAPDNYPVVHISWIDAQAYVAWLTGQTGENYRLPTEAELEYANRAGSRGRYWWGDRAPESPLANLNGSDDLELVPPLLRMPTEKELMKAFKDGEKPLYFEQYSDGYGGPAPVASFISNNFGLHDMTGNVAEWAQDCWHTSYEGAPLDGSAWLSGDSCQARVVRGGSWYNMPHEVRAAKRVSAYANYRNMYVGFRVARDLDG